MTIGTGIAIAAIWLTVALLAIFDKMVEDDLCYNIIGAIILTLILA